MLEVKIIAMREREVKLISIGLSIRNIEKVPFNPETWIPYSLAKEATMSVQIFDASGKLIRQLHLGKKPPGRYLSKEKAAYWDGRNEVGERVASGVYFYYLTAGDFAATRKLVVLE